jgi:renalase
LINKLNHILKTIIIGAGMAGLSAARILTQKGHDVMVLDKGRGVGGRMSTRTIENAKADHGAQYFSVKTPEFQELISSFQFENVIAEWHLAQRLNVRFVGANGMNTIPKKMASSLNVLVNEKVILVDNNSVTTESGKVYNFDNLIVTIPIPQVIELFQNSKIDFSEHDKSVLEQIEYESCLAVMAVLKQPTEIISGGVILQNQPVAWIADNFQKGITETPTVTIHASATYSAERFDEDLKEVANEMLLSVNQYVKPENVISFQTHRWKFSNATRRYDMPFYQIENRNIYLSGDGFGIGNVEGAFLSGYCLANTF